MEARIHQPLHLHSNTGDCGVGVCHVFLYSQAFVHDGHAGAGVEVGDGVGELADFVAEGFVEGEEVSCGGGGIGGGFLSGVGGFGG